MKTFATIYLALLGTHLVISVGMFIYMLATKQVAP